MSAEREVLVVSYPAVITDGSASAVVRGGEFLYIGGLTAIDPLTGKPAPGTTAAETRQILLNLQSILETAGSSLARVVKVNVLLAAMLEAPNMNEVFAQFFPEPPPARTVCGARLQAGVKVMIECTALA